MINRLEQAAAAANFQRNGYLTDRRSRYWKKWLAGSPPAAEKSRFLLPIVQDFIRANENQAALELLNTVTVDQIPDPVVRGKALTLLDWNKAIAWLRLGELENCLDHHTIDSCLLPIQPSGVHRQIEGSKKALELFLRILERDPGHRDSIWLANIAAMTLGRHPEALPEQFRIPAKAFQGEYAFPRFTDVARTAGVDIIGLAGGGITADFNNDHLLDLFVTSHGLHDQVRVFTGLPGGKYDDITQTSGLAGMHGGFNLSCADYNNDGWLDVLVLRGAWWQEDGKMPNSLLHNNGDGTFTDVTEAAGLLSFHPTQTSTWFDYNNDGQIDLFIGNERELNAPARSELYRNNGDGTFTEVAESVGLGIRRYVKGVTSADYDNDGLTDLYISIYNEKNLLFKNEGPAPGGGWRFTDVTTATGVGEPRSSFPCWFWDMDNDGWEDLFVAGYGMPGIGQMTSAFLGQTNAANGPRLYRNNRKGGFVDVSEPAGISFCWLPMGVNFGDLDNDGFLDFHIGTGYPEMEYLLPNRMYRNTGKSQFQDITATGGFGHLQKGHAVSFADYDNDGDQDVHVVMGGAYTGDTYMNALFKNPGNDHHWLKLKLIGKTSNRSAIGARIEVVIQTPTGDRHIHRTVNTGASFGCNPLRQEIGLGPSASIKTVKISWPTSATTQVFSDIEANALHEITESDPVARRISLP